MRTIHFVECNSNPSCSSLFSRRREGRFIIPPRTFVRADHVALAVFFTLFTWTSVCFGTRCIAMRVLCMSCVRAYLSSLPAALSPILAHSFEPLPLCGGSHLALFKEILMALDGILRPNFAVGNFAESGNSSSHSALPLFAILFTESINKWPDARSKSSLPLR